MLLKERGYFDAPVREKVEFTTKEFYLSHNLKFKEQYKMGETIGYGGLSTTRKCYHKMTGEVRAVKVTKKEDLEYGDVQVVVNVAVLTEGFDAPPISCIVLTRPCSYKSTMVQMIGRGLRPINQEEHPGLRRRVYRGEARTRGGRHAGPPLQVVVQAVRRASAG